MLDYSSPVPASATTSYLAVADPTGDSHSTAVAARLYAPRSQRWSGVVVYFMVLKKTIVPGAVLAIDSSIGALCDK